MTITRKITAITTATALAFTAMAPLATTASADGYRDGRHGQPDQGPAQLGAAGVRRHPDARGL